MKFPTFLKVYGETEFRGKCPKESMEQATFFNRLRREYPESYGLLALHPKNEAKRAGRDFQTLSKDKALGLAVGASDIIIPASPAFVCELKRRDHTLSAWQEGQLKYLEAAHESGAFTCVALGCDAAWEAFGEWLLKNACNA